MAAESGPAVLGPEGRGREQGLSGKVVVSLEVSRVSGAVTDDY